MQKRVLCGGVCALVLLVLGMFAAIGLQGVVDGVILDGVVLAPENSDLWGQNPGKSNVTTIRNFTFFNFTNPRGYLYRSQRPVFNQISNYVITELSNFTNITYTEDKSVINYNYWLHFGLHPQTRNIDEYVHVINLAPVGFWSQLDKVPNATFAIQGYGGLFVETNATIIVQAIGQGVSGQYLANIKSWRTYCQTLQITEEMCQFLWEDYFYGLGDPNNYSPWVNWLHNDELDSGNALVEYFGLDQTTVFKLKKLMKPWFGSVESILNDWYCNGNHCENYDLAIAQLGWSGLTSNPPSGQATDSVCQSDNVTCKGYPQLSAFYKYVFLNQTREKEYYNLSFGWEISSLLFAPRNGTLLNIGNLTQLFEIGEAYDLNPKDQDNLQRLKAVTHGDRYQAVVVWQYAKYFTNQFVLKKSQGGQRKDAGMAGIFSQAMYQSVTAFADWFVPETIAIELADRIGECRGYILSTTESISQESAELMCAGVDQENHMGYYKLVQPCNNPLSIPAYKSNYSLSDMALAELCDQTEASLKTVLDQSHQRLRQWYQCTVHPMARCTPFQLAAKQFFNSSVTLRPIHPHIYSPTLTAHEWNSDIPEFEYRHFLNQVFGDPWHDQETFTNYTRVASILSFDKFYSVPGTQDMLLENDADKFYEKYNWKNKTLLTQFMRFIVIQVGFGGLIQKRTPRQLIFGYTDPFLQQFKQMDPMLGGDPSIQTTIMVNDPNKTLEDCYDPQSMYTGYSNASLTRNYLTNYQYPYITYNKTYYDGYHIISQQVNPYREEVRLHGTDAVQNLPMSTTEDKQYIYVDTLYRVAEMQFQEETSKYGFDLFKYRISNNTLASSEEYPPNEIYYQKYKGLLNISFLGLPMFASKNHWYGADYYWMQQVDIYDESGTYKQVANSYDEVVLVLEPKSGATFEATLFLQSSVYVQPDMLFTRDKVLLPVLSVYRSANVSEEAAEELLGDLKIALAAPRALAIFSFSGLLLVIAAVSCCLIKKSRKSEPIPSLLESTENALLERDSHPYYEDRQEQVQQSRELHREPDLPQSNSQYNPINESVAVQQ